MKKLRRQIEFLERGLQRVRIGLNKTQDPLLTPTTSLTGIKPKQLITSKYWDYSENDHYLEKWYLKLQYVQNEMTWFKKQRTTDA